MFFKLKHGQRITQTGAVLVEFAILIPFLLLLLAGIAEIGYTYFHLDVLNKAVQDGARWFSDKQQARKGVTSGPINVDPSASGNGPNITKAKYLVIYGKTVVTADDTPLLPNGTAMTVTVTCLHDDGTDGSSDAPTPCSLSTTHHIRVTAAYNHPYILGNLLRNLCSNCIPANDYPLNASALFRVEGGN